ncbi:hypothetical protein [Duganella sp. BJB475]|uniref:hypothetical protein n=1 Tax=Duganella sp. BJB475 TaxID=2233914 RepID=UPI000E353F0E|nr:hypothetical protein [Duganella sp. BJB475]RFP19180.1 hypothetical protein D0T23_05205 [Duganella sp. BJB475]
MNKHQHHTNNAVLGAPAGWNQAEVPCSALPITRTECEGMPAVVSYWKPTAEELAMLNAGGSVALWVCGDSMPPVSLQVDPA